ncbi:unnamed protein product, partial [Rotaria sp. Silwood2]
MELPLTATTEK